MKIKVCGMRHSENIHSLCALPIQYIGFIFFQKSPRHAPGILSAETAKTISPGIRKTGVFVNAEIDYVKAQINEYGLQAVQLHGRETPQYCELMQTTGIEVIKAFGIDEQFDFSSLNEYKDSCNYFLFDTKSPKHGGTGVKFNWEILKQYDNSKPIFLSGGITIDDIQEIKTLSWLDIYALDLNSKFEIEPGLKDIALLSKFISKLNQ